MIINYDPHYIKFKYVILPYAADYITIERREKITNRLLQSNEYKLYYDPEFSISLKRKKIYTQYTAQEFIKFLMNHDAWINNILKIFYKEVIK